MVLGFNHSEKKEGGWKEGEKKRKEGRKKGFLLMFQHLLFAKNREVPFWKTLPKFVRLLDSHITSAMIAPVVAFGGWVPMIMNLSDRGMAVFNLPMVVGVVQTIASLGIFVTILLGLRMLPERPARYRKTRKILMVLQWVLAPVIALVYSSAAAYYSQTRLLTGKYMENFDVTKKVVKK